METEPNFCILSGTYNIVDENGNDTGETIQLHMKGAWIWRSTCNGHGTVYRIYEPTSGDEVVGEDTLPMYVTEPEDA